MDDNGQVNQMGEMKDEEKEKSMVNKCNFIPYQNIQTT
jgi:hypothetical protein